MIDTNVKHIVNFSGGKDSTAMLIRMLEENMKVDEIIFCKVMATKTIGGELPEMYEYIEKIDNYIQETYNKKITVITQEKSFEDYFYKKKSQLALFLFCSNWNNKLNCRLIVLISKNKWIHISVKTHNYA